MVTVELSIEETPPDHSGTHALARDVISTTTDDYAGALDQLARQIPDGWRSIAVRVDRTS